MSIYLLMSSHDAKLTLAPFLTDYGGSLPPLSVLNNPLNLAHPDDTECLPDTSHTISDDTQMEMPASLIPSPRYRLSPTNLLNPFFGYPVTRSQHSKSLSLQHGRRRKRDLLYTLLKLFWRRWNRPITAFLWLLAYILAIRMWCRRWVLYSPIAWKMFSTMCETGLTP
jgi:hypothetical protein